MDDSNCQSVKEAMGRKHHTLDCPWIIRQRSPDTGQAKEGNPESMTGREKRRRKAEGGKEDDETHLRPQLAVSFAHGGEVGGRETLGVVDVLEDFTGDGEVVD